MADTYDLVVIGSGPGGYVAAIRAAHDGLKTALVEKAPQLGGTCLHVGCIPTKALLENASVFARIRGAKEFGITTGEVLLDFAAVQKRKDRIVQAGAKGVEFLMKKNKVTVHAGTGRIAGKGKVQVKGADGSTAELATRNILIATGSVCMDIPSMPHDGKRILNSDSILRLGEVPKSMICLGSGAVGSEFACIFAQFGTKVTLVEMLPRILPREDEDCSKEAEKEFKKLGIDVRTGVRLEAVEVGRDSVKGKLAPADGKGEARSIEAECLLVAVGRKPYTEGLGLEGTKVRTEKGRILVDQNCLTAEPGIWAIGDVIGGGLAHAASAEGMMVADRIAGKPTEPIDPRRIPSCTYTSPEVASVGLTEAEARKQGYAVKLGSFPFNVLARAKIEGHPVGFVKIVSEEKYGEVLGVHIVGPHATELLAEACVALRLEATVEELARTIHAHPTLSEAVMEAAHAAEGAAIHI
jgi:dihydrolipoamide dehydrogenase